MPEFLAKLFRKLAPSRSATRDNAAHAVTPEGAYIYVDPADARGQKLIETGGNYNPPALAIWHDLLRSSGWTHVVDVGANYGEMLANGGLPPKARVIAIEPNKAILPYLRRTLRGVGRIKIYEIAVSDREGTSGLLITRDWSGTVRLVDEGQGDEIVNTTTLEKIIRAECKNIDAAKILLKVDVEGHEAKALSGLLPLLPRFKEFAALVEVAHLPSDAKSWIADTFDIVALDVATNTLVSVPNLNWGNSSQYYPYDVVLRRRRA